MQHQALLVAATGSRLAQLGVLLNRHDIATVRLTLGEAAVKLLRSRQIDVLLISHPLADIPTTEVIKASRSKGCPSQRCGIVVLSGDNQSTTAGQLLEAGANKVLHADCDAAWLGKTVGSLLGVEVRTELRTTLVVEIAQATESHRVISRMVNLSRSGMLVSSPTFPSIGSHFDFSFKLPEHDRPLRGTAKVVRHTVWPQEKIQGFGASFVQFNDDGHAVLDAFLSARGA